MIGHEIAHSFDILVSRKEQIYSDTSLEQLLTSMNVTNSSEPIGPGWLELSDMYENMTKCFSDQFSKFTIERIGENVRKKIQNFQQNILEKFLFYSLSLSLHFHYSFIHS